MASVFDVGALEYKDEAGNTREAQGVFISSTPEYTDAAGNVRSATPVYLLGGGPQPEPFWEPFTVTVGTDGEDFYGYLVDDPFSFGSITNQPVNGFTLMQAVNVGGSVEIRLHGPHPIVGELVGALVGISGEDYSIDEMSVTQSNDPETGLWVNILIIRDVPTWTIGQQIPIVVVPQP